jgi:hypothetical protein
MVVNRLIFRNMKKIFILLIFIIAITACENQPWSFPDYNLQAVYFPIQLPVRTLSLGEDRIDNSLDKEFKFDIGVSIGGMYANKQDWTVDYVVDTTLVRKVYIYAKPQTFSIKEKILALPSAYYTLTPASGASVTIPKGSFNGLIRVQLTDAFFNDTIALSGRYVIPLKITDTSADSILKGSAAITGADPRVVAQWNPNMSPKDWVMYGISYVNPYHGTWLHRGRDIRTNISTTVVDTVTFRTKYVERDATIKLTSTGRKNAISNGLGNKTGTNLSMLLNFANDKGTPGAITISKSPTSTFTVTGTGHYQDSATSVEKWTGFTWQSMYLNYTYNDGTYVHQILDSLVFRDRGIKFTANSIVIQP